MFRRNLLPTLVALMALCSAAGAYAQDGEAKEGGGVDIGTVQAGDIVLVQIAVPDAVNLGGAPDTRGVTEALTGTIVRDLQISGYFNLLDKAAYLVDPAKEGMNPDYTAWFNIGTQGLVKAGYRIDGGNVTVDLRLYSVDGNKQIKLPAPYDGPAVLPVDPGKLRFHAHGFVNEVIRYYTKAPGLFHTRIVAVKRLARAKELVMLAPDGFDEVQLTRTGGINMLPSLSGGRILFTSFRNGGAHLFTLQGGNAKSLAAYEGLNTGAQLKPGGGQIALTLSKDGNPEIYLIDANSGSVVKRLTDSWGIDTSPSWSPDGRQIAFVSDRQGSPQIWLMNADGSNQRRMTFQGDYNQTPDWSPKGDKVAFTARDERNVFDLFVLDVGSGQISRLTQNQGNNEEPSFSPDGRYIAFTSTRDGSSQIYIMTADGRFQTRISRGKGGYLTPHWGR
ncbi:MAG: PD40 domain-containing protein [Myxococcales bacterium]|nr:PD40 domain-containing protein [Myxococcales bacterium]